MTIKREREIERNEDGACGATSKREKEKGKNKPVTQQAQGPFHSIRQLTLIVADARSRSICVIVFFACCCSHLVCFVSFFL